MPNTRPLFTRPRVSQQTMALSMTSSTRPALPRLAQDWSAEASKGPLHGEGRNDSPIAHPTNTGIQSRLNARAPMNRILQSPVANIAVFAFLLNFPWEFLQTPLYQSMLEAAHWKATQRCTLATLGDVVIMVFAYGCIALTTHTLRWFERPTIGRLSGFVAVGVLVTVVIERLAFGDQSLGWRYASAMPIIPLVHVGLAPVMQWIILPLVAVWFVKRQLT